METRLIPRIITTTWMLSFIVVLFSMPAINGSPKYEPNWKSLDSRPLPSWYDEGKIGIFLHWGVFSVPSWHSAWFWEFWKGGKAAGKEQAYIDFMKNNYPPRFTYADFAPQFTAELFDPNEWAKIFQSSGAKYLVLTSKHHEGFVNYPSKYSFNWNSMDVGPKRDLVGDLAKAVRSHTDIKFGLYHSWFEFFHPLWLQDLKNNFQTNKFALEKAYPELVELVNTYKPEVIWSDGAWLAPVWYWNSTLFLSWLYNESPVKDTVVVNDRWGQLPDGKQTACKHGGFWDCTDKYNPGKLQPHKWENAFTLDKYSWTYNRLSGVDNYLTIEELLKKVVSTVAYGGNVLMNVGPTADGRIMPIFEERLRQLGSWLKVNGDAIYGTTPCNGTMQKDAITPEVFYTCKSNNKYFAMFLVWPENNELLLGSVKHCPAFQPAVKGLGKVSCQMSKEGALFDLKSVVSKVVTTGIRGGWVIEL